MFFAVRSEIVCLLTIGRLHQRHTTSHKLASIDLRSILCKRTKAQAQRNGLSSLCENKLSESSHSSVTEQQGLGELH